MRHSLYERTNFLSKRIGPDLEKYGARITRKQYKNGGFENEQSDVNGEINEIPGSKMSVE